jgi:predicted O-linked N-acetylglucosamine transferase (SPINDLY family)
VSCEPPGLQSGEITFICLNNPAKLSDEVLCVWARILADVPRSRILLRAPAGGNAEERLHECLAQFGIAPDRLVIAPQAATRFDYLELYRAADIALDPFPYNGVTTTCDALWMGVPAVSLAGLLGASRQGVRFLHALGLGELLAETLDDYVQIASALANDLDRLAALRNGLRARVTASALLDAERLTRDLETAYRTIWEKWQAGRDSIKGLAPSG